MLAIIGRNVSYEQEDKLQRVLKDHKTTIGWTIVDIKGITLSLWMKMILIEDEARLTRDVKIHKSSNDGGSEEKEYSNG